MINILISRKQLTWTRYKSLIQLLKMSTRSSFNRKSSESGDEYLDYDELTRSINPRDGQQLAISEEAGYFNELPTLREVDECVELVKDLKKDAGNMINNAKNMLAKVFKNVMAKTDNLMNYTQKLVDANNLVDTGNEFMGNISKLLDTGNQLMVNANKLVDFANKLMADEKNLMNEANKLNDIVLEWAENFSDWYEELGNGGSFPAFISLFLLARSEETIHLDELQTRIEVDECVEIVQDAMNAAKNVMAQAKNMMYMPGNVLEIAEKFINDTGKFTDDAHKWMDDVKKLDTDNKLMDIANKLVDDAAKFSDTGEDFIDDTEKLMDAGKNVIDMAEKLKDIMSEWEKNLNEVEDEDLGNEGPFPTFFDY